MPDFIITISQALIDAYNQASAERQGRIGQAFPPLSVGRAQAILTSRIKDTIQEELIISSLPNADALLTQLQGLT